MGVAKCTASRIPSMEFPDKINARREPACGARKTAPVWGAEKVQRPKKRKITAKFAGLDIDVQVWMDDMGMST